VIVLFVDLTGTPYWGVYVDDGVVRIFPFHVFSLLVCLVVDRVLVTFMLIAFPPPKRLQSYTQKSFPYRWRSLSATAFGALGPGGDHGTLLQGRVS
jgi:hypothetical protein